MYNLMFNVKCIIIYYFFIIYNYNIFLINFLNIYTCNKINNNYYKNVNSSLENHYVYLKKSIISLSRA